MTSRAYSQGVAPYYDLFDAEPAAAAETLALVQRFVPPGASVLEVGAGTGVLAFALAGAGYRVTAMEPDREMFAALLVRLVARRDLDARLAPVPRGIGYALGERLDACLSLAVFHLLDAHERHTLVMHAAQHLAPGGRLLLDVAVEGSERAERPRFLAAERRCGDTLFRKFVTMSRGGPRGRWQTTWELLCERGGVALDTVTRRFDWQAVPAAEPRALLAQHGFALEHEFAGASGMPFVEGESRSWLAVARRIAD